jgi:eukaryotic-like serine/threonine-protein kinase
MGAPDDTSAADPSKTAQGPAPALVSGGDLPTGYVVGEYRVDHVLGRGGMGVVYAAVQPMIEKRVAIKVLHSELSADPSLVRRFLDEARAVNRIRHPNIIDIFSFGQLADSRQYFVMEYLEGRTLAERLEAGDLPLGDFPLLLAQICDALDAAHVENIVHRDLKPENVWIVQPKRGRPFVKLLDFGIAKLLASGAQSTTRTGVVMGTPQYMSPEQCHGRAVDHRTDIYAMGVILYQVWTGKLPFSGETFAEVLTKQLTMTPERPSSLAAVPPRLDALIMRCLAKDPAGRPQSARELGEELTRGFADRPQSAPTAMLPPTTAVPTVRPRSTTTLGASAQGFEPAPRPERNRWPWLAAVVLVGAASAFAAMQLANRGTSTEESAPLPPRSLPASAPVEVVVTRDAGPDTTALAKREEAPPVEVSRPTREPAAKSARRPSSEASGKTQRTRAESNGLVTDNPFR